MVEGRHCGPFDAKNALIVRILCRHWFFCGAPDMTSVFKFIYVADEEPAETVEADSLVCALETLCARKKGNLQGINLSSLDLRGVDLRGADLRYAFLLWADFSGALLSGADLRWTQTLDAKFCGADLRGADFRGIEPFFAYWRGARLQGAKFSRCLDVPFRSARRSARGDYWEIL